MSLTRRHVLQAGAAGALGALAACERPAADASFTSEWVGAGATRGHRLREKSGTLPEPALRRRAGTLVLGGGIAGLSALRALVRSGDSGAQLLELEDQPGGNSRGHTLAGIGCPLGAHYLPVPGPQARAVNEWLHEIGLLRSELGRTVADERHLCHSPQERLFIDGAWQDGLLPSADGRPDTRVQYRIFSRRVDDAQRRLGFALPSHRAPWTAGHAALDAQTFAAWLRAEGLSDDRLLSYLDYACRDDYGAGLGTVSAWAGLHYFASRHGFHAPGDEPDAPDAVFTWPEGNAWLTRRLAMPLAERLHLGRTVLRVVPGRHGVQVWAWDEARQQVEAWDTQAVVIALPLFVAQRVLQSPPSALTAAASGGRYAPWLVANLHIDAPLLDRMGAPSAWDNVVFCAPGATTSLGYVDASHQSMSPVRGATVLTAYHALPETQRGRWLQASADDAARYVLADLTPLHPDLPKRLRHAALARHGHAMRIPVPGARGDTALQALRAQRGRVRFAHADLAGYSVFEEAFEAGASITKI
jgi:monoamine oxidase